MSEGADALELLDPIIAGTVPAGIATAVEARQAGVQRILLPGGRRRVPPAGAKP